MSEFKVFLKPYQSTRLSTLFYIYMEVQYIRWWIWRKAEFSALLQSSVSHDSSEITLIWRFADQETFIRITTVKKRCVA